MIENSAASWSSRFPGIGSELVAHALDEALGTDEMQRRRSSQ
jgi:hypothetical protein